MDHIVSIPASADSIWVASLAIVNSAAVNMGCMYLFELELFLFQIYALNGIAGSHDDSIFSF